MSLGLYTYSAAYPVLGALKSKALRESVIDSMLEAGDVEGCVRILAQSVGREPVSTRPLEVEGWLWGNWEEQGKELARFMRGNGAVFLRFFVAESDVRKLKLKVRQIQTRQESGAVAHSERRGVLIRDRKLEAARTLNRLVRAVSGTPLEAVLRKALPAVSGGESLLRFDLTLETNYERSLAREVDGLGAEGRRARSEFFDGMWGLRDLLKALRLRFGYGLEPQEVFHYVAFASAEFGLSHFWEMMNGDEPGRCMNLLPKGKLRARLAKTEPIEMSVGELEVAARKYTWQVASARQPGSPFALITFLRYLTLQEMLIEDAITVLGAKRSGLAEDEVRPLLSFTPGE